MSDDTMDRADEVDPVARGAVDIDGTDAVEGAGVVVAPETAAEHAATEVGGGRVGSDPTADAHAGPGGPLFWASMVFGAVVIAVTVVRYRAGAGSPGQQSTARFLLGAGIAHDALWAPVGVVVGLLTYHLVPAWCRVPVRLGLAFTALVVLVSWPEVRGYGRTASNPSILPLDYGRNLVIVLVLIWTLVAVAVTARVVRGRSPS